MSEESLFRFCDFMLDSAFLCEILLNDYAVIARFCVSRIVAIHIFLSFSRK
ncbi:hypothetical protein ACWIUD_05030 [Helicobacter sp. 23-1044]